ncbi:hypothetical protein [Sediminibacillus massiliensis]|uniref:hypothetical protein n=1 Tax=Sediminibacillus massiliensis TaxID=1926277 RepID=UPI0009886D79|nr:hypothetical protein [Sediminibacillus massiliensis]
MHYPNILKKVVCFIFVFTLLTPTSVFASSYSSQYESNDNFLQSIFGFLFTFNFGDTPHSNSDSSDHKYNKDKKKKDEKHYKKDKDNWWDCWWDWDWDYKHKDKCGKHKKDWNNKHGCTDSADIWKKWYFH